MVQEGEMHADSGEAAATPSSVPREGIYPSKYIVCVCVCVCVRLVLFSIDSGELLLSLLWSIRSIFVCACGLFFCYIDQRLSFYHHWCPKPKAAIFQGLKVTYEASISGSKFSCQCFMLGQLFFCFFFFQNLQWEFGRFQT
jgi:hypothetical protein